MRHAPRAFFIVLLLTVAAAGRSARTGEDAPQANISPPALAIDGEPVSLDAYARWLVQNLGERNAYVYARDHRAVEQAAREAGVDVSAEECARIVDAALAERIEKAFGGVREDWLDELARTGHTEAGVRLLRANEARPMELARKIAALGRVVPEAKIVRDWELSFGRGGRGYELLLTKTLVVVPSEEGQTRAQWEERRQQVMHAGLERARAVRARIAAGEDFGRVARETSDDPITRDQRGALPGGFRHTEWPANFLDALDRLAPGQLSEPLYARGGWWVVRVESVKVTPLESVHAQIERRLAERGPEDDEIAAVLTRVRDATTFKILPGLFEEGSDAELGGPLAPVLEVNGEAVARADFTRWLVAAHGESSLPRFREDWAIERAACEAGVTVTNEEIEARVRLHIERSIDLAHGSSRETYATFLALKGRSTETVAQSLRARARTDLLAQKLYMRARVITPEAVRARYVSDFGTEGERLEVRWIVEQVRLESADPKWTREQLTNALQAASQAARVRLEALLERARAGADFAELARTESDDVPTRADGGRIPGRFRADAYPDGFGAAVAALQPGGITAALDYRNAWVAFQLVARRRVAFEDVREELAKELAEESPEDLDVVTHRNVLAHRHQLEILPGLSGGR